jgi:hypothetical protein
MRLRHSRDDVFLQPLPRFVKRFKRDRPFGHAVKAARKFPRNIFRNALKNFPHGPVVAEKVNDKRTAKIIVDAFIGYEIAVIEEVTRMLAIKCCDDLARVEISKRYGLYFSEAEFIFNGGRYATNGRMRGAVSGGAAPS